MPLGLHARIAISPAHVMTSRWAHDMANALCRARLTLDLQWRDGAPTRPPACSP
ncbi:MAG: hypothetical protein KGL53_17210 [Elusimicrobia bacterium]|nr:hypothetical protein [Elusimicrobiota bacterium]